jgi:hypothetical protein
MLRSEPNVRCCLCPGNKVTLKNESNFRVCYEIVVLKGAKVNHLKVGVSGPGGNGINGEADIKDAERLPPERGELYPHRPVFVTISGGKIFTVRYKYVGLHTNWAPETRNFSVLDDLVFEQPHIEDIDRIHKVDEEEKRKNEEEEVRLRKEKEMEKRKREEEEVRLRKEREIEKKKREEEERKKREEEKAVQRMCSSTFKHMCSAPDTPRRQCPRCGDWYCNYHFIRNNNPFGRGGHVCN